MSPRTQTLHLLHDTLHFGPILDVVVQLLRLGAKESRRCLRASLRSANRTASDLLSPMCEVSCSRASCASASMRTVIDVIRKSYYCVRHVTDVSPLRPGPARREQRSRRQARAPRVHDAEPQHGGCARGSTSTRRSRRRRGRVNPARAGAPQVRLLDLNLLVYAMDESSARHTARAGGWIGRYPDRKQFAMAWNVMIGVLRHSTQCSADADFRPFHGRALDRSME